MQKNNSYILWLASWYPNEQEPFDGDFIQRHAKAVSSFLPIKVIHVLQYGENSQINKKGIETRISGNLEETIITFKFFRTGIGFIDKLFFNLRYYSVYKKYILQLFIKEGIPDLVHVHVPMKAGMIALWIKKKWKVPYIISEQASTYEEAAPDFFSKRSLYYQRSVKKIFENADAATNVSKKMGERIKKLLKIKKEILTVPNVADESLFNYISNQPQSFCFIHVSGMNEQKNITGILKVFRKLYAIRNDWTLKLVGPYNSVLKSFVSSLGLDQSVHFTGEVSYNEVAKHMQLSSALVMFSRHENFPCVVVEALCCGLPVVASEVGGISEAVNESNGILVPSEDENSLLEALQKMMNNYNSYNREKISKDALDRFSMKNVGEKFCLLYDQVIAHS